MARRSRRFGSTKPPKALNLKPVQVDVAGLAAAYEWLLIDRLQGMQQAVEWYQANIAVLLYGKPLDESERKVFDKAAKAKTHGDSPACGPDEKLQAWSTALRLYERIWVARHTLPTVDAAIKNAEDGGTPGKRIAAMGDILKALSGAYAPLGVNFNLGTGAEREFTAGTLQLPRAEIEALVGTPLLKIVLAEAPNVAKILSIVTREGVQMMDGDMFMTNLPNVLTQVHTWAAGTEMRKITKEVSVPGGRKRKAVSGVVVARSSVRFKSYQVIHLVGKRHAYHGKRAKLFELVMDGMTIADYKQALAAAGYISVSPNRPLNRAVEHGLITVQ